MKQKVVRTQIDEYVDRNGPDGLVKLAQAAGVSSSYMSKVRNGKVPAKLSTRLKICAALHAEESAVFIPVRAGKSRAS